MHLCMLTGDELERVQWAHGWVAPFNSGLSVKLFVLTDDYAIQMRRHYQTSGYYAGHTQVEPRVSLSELGIVDLPTASPRSYTRLRLGYAHMEVEITPANNEMTRTQSETLLKLVPNLLRDLKSRSRI